MREIFLSILFLAMLSPLCAWKAEGSCQLLELYTSEGCSSCPPADRWISSLKKSPALWTEVVPLSFHVNYWDYIGWKDRLAKKEFGDRQRNYANSWKINTVYTPGIVLQGLESEMHASLNKVEGRLEADWNGKILIVRGKKITESTTLHIAWLGLDISSAIKRGENTGQNLKHDFVVLFHGILGAWVSGKEMDFTMPTHLNENPKALAIWLELNHKPVIAIGNFL